MELIIALWDFLTSASDPFHSYGEEQRINSTANMSSGKNWGWSHVYGHPKTSMSSNLLSET